MERGIKRALAVTSEIVRQNPRGVASLFREYGINAPPTGKNLFFGIVKHKGQFVNDLYDHVESPFSGADGSISPLKPITNVQVTENPIPIRTSGKSALKEPKEKGRFFSLMENVFSTAASGFSLYNTIKGGGAGAPTTFSDPNQGAPTGGNSKNMILIAVGIVVVLVLGIFLIRKK